MSKHGECLVAVSLTFWQWAEVAVALQTLLRTGDFSKAQASRADALFSLREIDRVMLGADEHRPADEVMGG